MFEGEGDGVGGDVEGFDGFGDVEGLEGGGEVKVLLDEGCVVVAEVVDVAGGGY